jgi:thiol-disulfide isomerase/thioredoxin
MKLKHILITILITLISITIACTGTNEDINQNNNISDENNTEEDLGEMVIHAEDIGMFSCAAKVSLIQAEGKAKDFTLIDIEGNEVSLSDFMGSYIHLDFSVEWCPKCANQASYLSQLEEAMEGKDFLSITILFQNEEAQPATIDDAKDWINTYSISDVLIGNDKLAKDYVVNYTPTNYIISPNMEMLGGWSGSESLDVFMENLLTIAPGLFED